MHQAAAVQWLSDVVVEVVVVKVVEVGVVEVEEVEEVVLVRLRRRVHLAQGLRRFRCERAQRCSRRCC